MPNPLELLTKPLQIGAQVAFGAIENIQKLVQSFTGGDDDHAPPPTDEKSERRQSPPKQLDDATITDKVESILFRDPRAEKGKIDVNTTDGVVWLRGEVRTPERIKEFEATVRAIPEVRDVENLLHLPKTPAQKKPRRATPARKRTPKRTTAERKTTTAQNAEPTPKELASKGEGRQPAPLGSSGNGSSAGTDS